MFCKIILPNNEIHVLPSVPSTFDDLQQLIQTKFQAQLPQHYSLKYKDSDEELVLLVSDDDLKTATITIEKEKLKNLRIVVVPEKTPRNGNTKTKTAGSIESPPKDEYKKQSSFGKGDISQISMTESITELPNESSTSQVGYKSNNAMELSHQWEELGLASEAVSQFFSPIPKRDIVTTNSRKSFFGKQNSLGNDETEALLRTNEEQLFNQEQMKVIGDIIDKNINKHIVSKLESILSEALMGVSGNLRSSMTKKSFAHISPLTCTNTPVPFGMRLSTKKCKELADCNNNVCFECKSPIKDIRYICLSCKDYNCCEHCENSVEHPHPLLKIRIPKTDETVLQNNSATHLPLDKQSGKKVNPNNDDQVERSPVRSRTWVDSSLDAQGLLDPTKTNKSVSVAHVSKPLESCDVREFLRYKVALVKEPVYDVIRVKANHDYSVEFTVKNAGVNKWENRVSLLCINGIHKGDEQELPALAPGQEYVVNLYLTAPADSGRFLSQWQFHSFDGGAGKPFGKPIYIEIDVSPGSKESQSKVNNEHQKNSYSSHNQNLEKKETRNQKEKVHQEIGVQEKDKRLMKESQCSESVLKRAKLLNDMFPGEIKEKIVFVNAYPASLGINDLVSAYLDRLSAANNRKGPGALKK